MNADVDIGAAHLTVHLRRARRRLGDAQTYRRAAAARRGRAHRSPVASHGPWLGAGCTHALLDYAVAAGLMLVHCSPRSSGRAPPERSVTIELEDEPFDRLVIEGDDTRKRGRAIQDATGARARVPAAHRAARRGRRAARVE